MDVSLQRGDCIALMKKLADGSVDLILCDLPYGVTDCRWDKRIPYAPLWAEYARVLKGNGALLLFGQQPFSTELAARAGRELRLRYEWVWDKGQSTGFANANRMPMRRHENILVFYRRLPTYNPQGLQPCAGGRLHRRRASSSVYGRIGLEWKPKFTGFPTSVVQFRRERGALPCQKPVALLEYLIRTYTDAGQTVLDNCMGTGSTGVAAVRTGRAFVGMELDAERFSIAEKRIAEAAHA